MRLITLKVIILSFTFQLLAYDQIDSSDSLSIMNQNYYLKNDSLGNIWIGYRDLIENTAYVPKVALWDGDNLKIFNGDDDLPYGVVRDIFIKNNGSVVLITDSGLRIFDKDIKSYVDFNFPQNEDGFRKISPNESNQGNQIVEDKNGVLWCLTKLYEKENIYSEQGNYSINGTEELWKFENEKWSKVDFIDFFNTFRIEIVNFDENRILIYGIDFSDQGISLPSLININDNTISDFSVKEFTKGQVNTQISEAYSYDGNIIFSYQLPSNSSISYEGFSIYDIDLQSWTHYGAEPYLDYDNDFEFFPIPSAYDVQNGTKFASSNWIRKIRESRGYGFWFCMLQDYNEDWFEQKGGGLVHFDGKDSFIRYSVPLVEEIRPLELSPNLERASDSFERSDINSTFMNGVAYDKNGDLWFGSLFAGIWIVPKELLPDKINSVESAEKIGFIIDTSHYDINGNEIEIQDLKKGDKYIEVNEFNSGIIKSRKLIK